jgi:hypothetical protein
MVIDDRVHLIALGKVADDLLAVSDAAVAAGRPDGSPGMVP